jgi:hypothetical protein
MVSIAFAIALFSSGDSAVPAIRKKRQVELIAPC